MGSKRSHEATACFDEPSLVAALEEFMSHALTRPLAYLDKVAMPPRTTRALEPTPLVWADEPLLAARRSQLR